MRPFDRVRDLQALRDECVLAGTPVDGDEHVAALVGTLRGARGLARTPVPSAALAALLDHGFEPSGSTTRRLRLAVARRVAATGLTLKVLIGTVAVGAGVATAGVVGSVPGEAIVSDAVDAVTPGGTDEDGGSPGAPAEVKPPGPTSEPSPPSPTAVAPEATPSAAGEPVVVDEAPGSVGGGPTTGQVPPGQSVDGPPGHANKPDKTPPGQDGNGNGNGNPGGNGNGNGHSGGNGKAVGNPNR